jgi:hypothetical protein
VGGQEGGSNMISDRELERLLYPMSLSWLRATLSAVGLEIVPRDRYREEVAKINRATDRDSAMNIHKGTSS